ncbi:MAG: AAA family ATPase [Lentisphaeria bacterium]|nr:AAA family ATPase [Lentisphaeria bacterium]
MKVTKIHTIENLAVFKDFKWDDCVKDKDGRIQTFQDINIIYGRNYSGKTTLSRIFRAFETGKISDKYVNPKFQLKIKDGEDIDQTQIANKQNFRVFNSDFIDENLSFLRDSDSGNIQPFAILGDGNTTLASEIESLQNELGKNTEEEKTGLYKALGEKEKAYKDADKNYKDKINSLSKRLTDKASQMKNQNSNFVSPNYDKIKLKSDIEQLSSFTSKTEQEITDLKKLLLEETKASIRKAYASLQYDTLISKTKDLLASKVESADKIRELVENSLLNNWVKEGLDLHKERNTCAFCGQPIPSGRLETLQHHFNEEMDALQNDLRTEITKIEDEKTKAKKITENISETDLYVKFQNNAKTNLESIKKIISNYCQELDKLSAQLENKKKDVFHELVFEEPNNHTQELTDAIEKYNEIVEQALQYGGILQKEKDKAKHTLRFNVVKQFVDDIKYSDLYKEIDDLKKEAGQKKTEFDTFKDDVGKKETELAIKKSQLNDEEKGANKVNEYLTNFFGHEFLQLVPIKEESENEDAKHYRFEIQRNGKKAYNLSEGECRLVAFSYFMAKLNDTETAGKKPLIWIDDPICSLDANHVFFVYSLISSEIAIKDNFEQLFITTHNLDFLKYLKRLKGKYVDNDRDRSKGYFIIERKNDDTNLMVMPKYMKDFVTEFNYLFDSIYKCANSELGEETYPLFYNFSNNARKFLEIYLFYKYPDDSEDRVKQESFFGEKIPVFLNERVTNEYSHLKGDIERASNPVEYPVETMKKDAQMILECIQYHDQKQYDALLNSIGVNVSPTE